MQCERRCKADETLEASKHVVGTVQVRLFVLKKGLHSRNARIYFLFLLVFGRCGTLGLWPDRALTKKAFVP